LRTPKESGKQERERRKNNLIFVIVVLLMYIFKLFSATLLYFWPLLSNVQVDTGFPTVIQTDETSA
jgi:hypothetical protein